MTNCLENKLLDIQASDSKYNMMTITLSAHGLSKFDTIQNSRLQLFKFKFAGCNLLSIFVDAHHHEKSKNRNTANDDQGHDSTRQTT